MRLPASQTVVSAPWAGVRRAPFITLKKPGRELRTPGVSAQPGCMLCTVIVSAAQRWASSSVSVTCMRLVRA